MNYYKLAQIALFSLMLMSCGTESKPDIKVGEWKSEGLENQDVKALEASTDFLFAAGGEQLFKSEISRDDEKWAELSLTIDSEISEFGDILYRKGDLYAVVRNLISYELLSEDYTSLYKSIDQGNSWEPVQIILEGREKPYVINRLAQNEHAIYADWHLIFASTDGKNWLNLNKDENIGVSEFLYISTEHPNQIWTGGWNNTFKPYLSKSNDGGETWTNLNQNIYYKADATVYAASIHPENEQTVLVGLGGVVSSANVIRKSEDGGETWNTVLEGYNIRVLKNSAENARRVYASGISPDGRLFVAISNNYGNSWEIEAYEGSPAGIRTNDMIVIEVDGKETLYFGTNKGVYSYTFSE